MRPRFSLRTLLYVPFFVGLTLTLWSTLMVVGCERHIPLPATEHHGGYTYDTWLPQHWPAFIGHRVAVWRELGR